MNAEIAGVSCHAQLRKSQVMTDGGNQGHLGSFSLFNVALIMNTCHVFYRDIKVFTYEWFVLLHLSLL